MIPPTTVQCARCMSKNVYCKQNVIESGNTNWEIVACQDCDWPHEDNRGLRQMPEEIKSIVADAHEHPENLRKHEKPKFAEDTADKVEEYPQ